MTYIEIRPATLADCRDIAYVHVESWKSTYHGLMPAEMIESKTIENRETLWKQILMEIEAGTSTTRVFVAEVTQQPHTSSIEISLESSIEGIVGFISGGKIRDARKGFDGEIYAMYLLELVQRYGIGSSLFKTMLGSLGKDNYHSILVWVLESNRSKRFYQRMGGKESEFKTEKVGEKLLHEVGFAWKIANG